MQSSVLLRFRQRWWCMAIAILLLICLLPNPAVAAPTSIANPTEMASPDITVYRDPSCRCCGGWIDHLKAAGFNPKNVPTSEMEAIKRQYGVSESMASCHTAIVDGYVVEGHVPVADMQRLLNQRPSVVGIAVPGMPVGTPGMESGDQRDDFSVLSFDRQGNSAVFNQYDF